MSFYLQILTSQPVFDMGVDDNDRTVVGFNIDALARYPVDKFEEEIARIIFDASLGTFGTDMFIGSNATLPTTAGPFVDIIRTPSYPALETHNGDKYEYLSCQITVRAKSYVTARNRAIAIWRALDGQRNITVTAA